MTPELLHLSDLLNLADDADVTIEHETSMLIDVTNSSVKRRFRIAIKKEEEGTPRFKLIIERIK